MTLSSSSPLLDLAVELQELVLAKYYEGTSLNVDYRDDWMIIKGIPSLGLELTCKALRAQSLVARNEYVSRVLTAKGPASMKLLSGLLSSQQDLQWPLEHITSLRLTACNTMRDLLQDDLQRMLRSCPNITSIEFHTSSGKGCMPVTTQQYMPLEVDDNKRRLIADVLRYDWEPLLTTSGISKFLCSVEKAWFRENTPSMARDSSAYKSGPEKRLDLTVVSTIDAVDNKRTPFYQAVFAREP